VLLGAAHESVDLRTPQISLQEFKMKEDPVSYLIKGMSQAGFLRHCEYKFPYFFQTSPNNIPWSNTGTVIINTKKSNCQS